jgi:hypothetical protein
MTPKICCLRKPFDLTSSCREFHSKAFVTASYLPETFIDLIQTLPANSATSHLSELFVQRSVADRAREKHGCSGAVTEGRGKVVQNLSGPNDDTTREGSEYAF